MPAYFFQRLVLLRGGIERGHGLHGLVEREWDASGSGDGSHANAVKVVLFVEAASAGAGLSTHRRGEGKERQRKAACSYTRGVATGHLRSHEFFLFS
jgi:hypothetical protein